MQSINRYAITFAVISILGGCATLSQSGKEAFQRIVNDGTGASLIKEFTCRISYDEKANIEYSEADAFDCQLRKSLAADLESVTVKFPSSAEYTVDDSDASGIDLPIYVPERAAAWIGAIKASDEGKVWKCNAGPADEAFPWAIVVKEVLGFAISHFTSDDARARRLYSPASRYNVKLNYLPSENDSKLTTVSAEFVHKELGDSTVGVNCKPEL